MELKPYKINKSEKRTESIIKSVLENQGYRIVHSVKMKDIIEYHDRDNLTEEEKKYIEEGEIDFVIYNAEDNAILALEFDGPLHELKNKKIKTDIRKNRLCNSASLPMIRVTDVFIETKWEVPILEYILDRFVRYESAAESIREEIENIYSEEDIDRLLKEYYPILPPELDVEFLYGLENGFPGTKEIGKRLFDEFEIVSNIYQTKAVADYVKNSTRYRKCMIFPGQPIDYSGTKTFFKSEWFLYEIETGSYNPISFKNGLVSGQGVTSLGSGQAEFALNTILHIKEDFDPYKESIIEYFQRTGDVPFIPQGLPGASFFGIGQIIAEFLALRDAEIWVYKHLTKTT